MRRVVLITSVICAFAFAATPGRAEMISFADSIAGVDGGGPAYGGSVNWSTGDSTVDLLQHSYSLLGGMASVSAYKNNTSANLSHRGTRGLGVSGSENDEVDRHIANTIEHIDILFSTKPYYIHEIEVRSLFDFDTGGNEEWAAIGFWKDGDLIQTEYLLGTEDLVGGNDGDASWSGTPVLVDKLVFYVPSVDELINAGMNINLGNTIYDPLRSEFAVAKIRVTPIPASMILGVLGMGVVGLKLRRYT